MHHVSFVFSFYCVSHNLAFKYKQTRSFMELNNMVRSWNFAVEIEMKEIFWYENQNEPLI